jgi:FixJ family two-component response regulator
LRKIKACLARFALIGMMSSPASEKNIDLAHTPPTVLVVEDDDALRTAIAFSLETEGLKVEACVDAEQALQVDLAACSCLIVDYWLPGANGLALLTRLRALGVQAPAMLITTHPSALMRARAANVGADIVEKPLMDDAIVHAVKRALKQ